MKFTAGLLVGAALGAAVVHYLNTYEGKALVKRVKDDAEEMSDNLSGIADDLVAKGKSIIGQKEDDLDAVEQIVIIGLNDNA